jgi:DNA-binding Lrp family transcriptional regulator
MVSAVVLLSVEHDWINEVAQTLAAMDGVGEVYSVAGRYDLVAVVRVKTNDEVAELITAKMLKVPHIQHAETLIAFRVFSKKDLDAGFSLGND